MTRLNWTISLVACTSLLAVGCAAAGEGDVEIRRTGGAIIVTGPAVSLRAPTIAERASMNDLLDTADTTLARLDRSLGLLTPEEGEYVEHRLWGRFAPAEGQYVMDWTRELVETCGFPVDDDFGSRLDDYITDVDPAARTYVHETYDAEHDYVASSDECTLRGPWFTCDAPVQEADLRVTGMDAYLVIESLSRGLWLNDSTFYELQGSKFVCTGADCDMAAQLIFGYENGFDCRVLHLRKMERVEE